MIIYDASPEDTANRLAMPGGMGTAFIDLSGCWTTQTMVAEPVAMASPARVISHVYFMLRCEMTAMRMRMSTSSSNRSGRLVLEARRDARKANSRLAVRDAQTGRTPQPVFGLLHVAEVVAEMNDAGPVTLVEEDAAPQRELRNGGTQCVHRSRVADAGVLRQEEAREQTVDAQQAVTSECHRLVGDGLQIPLGFE